MTTSTEKPLIEVAPGSLTNSEESNYRDAENVDDPLQHMLRFSNMSVSAKPFSGAKLVVKVYYRGRNDFNVTEWGNTLCYSYRD